MLKKERQNMILELLKEKNYSTVTSLANRLFVAPITVRRDLDEMEASGLIIRCHGGAALPDYENREVPFELRNRSNFPAKEKIARKATELIHSGDVLFLDASSTVSHITEYLSPEQNLTVITNSIFVAERLKEKHILCYLTGGRPVENSYALVGDIAQRVLMGCYANICFFSAQGIDENGVISDQSERESALRQTMLQNSEKQYFLYDRSKYGKRFTFRLCSVEEITDVITDTDGTISAKNVV